MYIYIYMCIYQKYIKASAKVGNTPPVREAISGPKTERVPTNIQFFLMIISLSEHHSVYSAIDVRSGDDVSHFLHTLQGQVGQGHGGLWVDEGGVTDALCMRKDRSKAGHRVFVKVCQHTGGCRCYREAGNRSRWLSKDSLIQIIGLKYEYIYIQ